MVYAHWPFILERNNFSTSPHFLSKETPVRRGKDERVSPEPVAELVGDFWFSLVLQGRW